MKRFSGKKYKSGYTPVNDVRLTCCFMGVYGFDVIESLYGTIAEESSNLSTSTKNINKELKLQTKHDD